MQMREREREKKLLLLLLCVEKDREKRDTSNLSASVFHNNDDRFCWIHTCAMRKKIVDWLMMWSWVDADATCTVVLIVL